MNVMRSRKNGVAVIIVLGVLALLMVMGVAFSVSMRVERAGAANYASAVNSRQLVWAGLARAVTDITTATTNFYPGDYLVSRNATAIWNTNGTSGIMLGSGQVRDHVPGVLLDDNPNEPDPYITADDCISEWVRLRTTDGMGGHVAYLVLNLSDLLDVNYVGGATRAGGTNAAEMVLSGLNPPVAANVLVKARTDLTNAPPRYPYFESLAEFRARVPTVPADLLVDFSRYPPDSNRTNALYIGGTVAELEVPATRAAIIEKIAMVIVDSEHLPLNQAQAQAVPVFDYLLDYLDTNSTPRNLLGPNTEAVPMLNEVAPESVFLRRRNSLWYLGARLRIETWYPFVQTNRFGYSFDLSGEYEARLTVSNELNGVYPEVTTNASFITRDLRPLTINYDSLVDIVSSAQDNAGASNWWFRVNLAISNLTVTSKKDGQTNIVDSAGTAVFRFSYTNSVFLPPSVIPLSLTPVSYQTTDPRFNWRQSDWRTYSPPSVVNTNTLGDTNLWTIYTLASRKTGIPQIEWDAKMHVSNLGRLYSPLELGNILRRGDQPWITFRVFSQGASALRHPLLENFTTDQEPAKRGLVNANTVDPALLAPAFMNMPNPYVGGAPLGAAELAAVTNLISSARAAGTVFTNVTDLLEKLDWRGQAALAGKSDVELEAMAAYSTGLLGVRQNLFLIVVTGSVAEEGMGVKGQDIVRTQARKTAVVLLWRDPVARVINPGPNQQLYHDCFVRYFKWMED
jgi:hypothetical protein